MPPNISLYHGSFATATSRFSRLYSFSVISYVVNLPPQLWHSLRLLCLSSDALESTVFRSVLLQLGHCIQFLLFSAHVRPAIVSVATLTTTELLAGIVCFELLAALRAGSGILPLFRRWLWLGFGMQALPLSVANTRSLCCFCVSCCIVHTSPFLSVGAETIDQHVPAHLLAPYAAFRSVHMATVSAFSTLDQSSNLTPAADLPSLWNHSSAANTSIF